MQDRKGICAGGNWIIDRIKIVDTYPKEGNLANILTAEAPTNGGSSYNVLVDLARLGLDIPLQAIGVLGDDDDADFILNDCRKHGINCELLKKRKGSLTSYTDVITVENTGQRTFFHARGANALLDVDDFDVEKIRGRICLLGYLLLLDRLDSEDPEYGTRAARLLSRLSSAGIKTAVDVVSEESERFARVVRPALPYTDYLIVNEIEAGKITGFPLRRDDSSVIEKDLLLKAAETIFAHGVREYVIIHFPEGSFSYRREGPEIIFEPSLNLPRSYIKGTTGAGDAFCAGCLYGIHSGWETERILQFATAMAAACLSHPSASYGIKSYQEIMEIYNRYEKGSLS